MDLEDKFEKFRDTYILEKHRIDSFEEWPYDENSSCSITKMAEAGFYWSGNRRENDTVTCFLCGKTLDGWESSDDPWKEHAKHAPQCMFVKQGRREKDLTVESFLNIFGVVVKQKLMKSVENSKKELRKWANSNITKFSKKKSHS